MKTTLKMTREQLDHWVVGIWSDAVETATPTDDGGWKFTVKGDTREHQINEMGGIMCHDGCGELEDVERLNSLCASIVLDQASELGMYDSLSDDAFFALVEDAEDAFNRTWDAVVRKTRREIIRLQRTAKRPGHKPPRRPVPPGWGGIQ